MLTGSTTPNVKKNQYSREEGEVNRGRGTCHVVSRTSAPQKQRRNCGRPPSGRKIKGTKERPRGKGRTGGEEGRGNSKLPGTPVMGGSSKEEHHKTREVPLIQRQPVIRRGKRVFRS